MKFIKKFKWQILILFVFLIGMIFATFYDLQISKKLADVAQGSYYSTNFFGRICEYFGVVPVYLLVAISCIVIYQNLNRRKNQKYGTLFKIFVIIMSVIILAFMAKKVFKYIGKFNGFEYRLGYVWDMLAYLLFGVIITWLFIIATNKCSNAFLNNALCFAVIIIVTASVSEGITHLIKPFACRARFRTLSAVGDYSLFTPWYVFNGEIKPSELMNALGIVEDGFKSFPSGHSSSVATLIVLTALPKYIPSLNKKSNKIILNVLIFGIICAVMYARILVGAHYLSDVLVGAFITFICYFAVDKIVTNIFEKNIRIQPLNEKVKIIRLEEESI